MVELGVLRDVLRDRSLTQVDDGALVTNLPLPISITGLTFGDALSLRVLNRAGDRDDDAVFDTGANPHIAFDVQSAWVKYKLSAKATGAIPFAKGSAEVVLSDYRVHAANERALSAIAGDVATPRAVLRLDDVRRLAPGEALAMDVGGVLSAKVSFSWTDALSTRLGDVIGELDVPIAIKLKSGMETTASVSISDHFSVVISRTRGGRFRFAVKKAKSRDHTYSLDASFGVDFSASPAIDEVLSAITAANPLVEKARDEVRKRLIALAHWKVSTGLAYEYSRIDENTAIADFILEDESLLEHDHALVLSGEFGRVIDELRVNTSARTLVRYLNETTLTRRSSSGFSLGIGKWISVKAQDESVFHQSTRKSLDDFVLVTCRGTRRYSETHVPENDFEWIVDMKAQMNDFASAAMTRDFDYGLHYNVALERERLSHDDVRRVLDFGAMWDVRVPDTRVLEESIGRKSTLRVQLVFDRNELEATLSTVTPSLHAWAGPLAMAMPYMKSFEERNNFVNRREVYTEAWRTWLGGTDARWGAFLGRQIQSGLILVEERRLPGSFAWTCGEGHAHLRENLTSFVRGAQSLHAAMTSDAAPEAIGTAYDALQRFWNQRLYIAASGRFLLDRAREAGVRVSRSLTVEHPEGVVIS